MKYYFRIGLAADKLEVCTKTIHRWEKDGKIVCQRTLGGHRRIAIKEIKRLLAKMMGKKSNCENNSKVAIYARVSSHEQKKKGDLERQINIMQKHCETQKDKSLVFTDIASGLNTNRRGLTTLFRAIEKGEIAKVIVTYHN